MRSGPNRPYFGIRKNTGKTEWFSADWIILLEYANESVYYPLMETWALHGVNWFGNSRKIISGPNEQDYLRLYTDYFPSRDSSLEHKLTA